ncbi:hypothetical protein [Salinibacter sp.]|uniref:hypothetical protein n=1 Tax=Salinibacter sp. TaxID=2065818 RepID=UPI0021E71D14|nr:hypothetical protein [Salinibacter sp.]
MIRFSCPVRIRPDAWFWLGLALLGTVLGAGIPCGAAAQPADVQSLLDRGATAGADVEQMRTVVERARQAGLSNEATAALLDPAVALAEQNLPTKPLLSKTLEGLAKQVPPSRMQPVLRQYRIYTEEADQVVAQWTQRDRVRQMLDTEGGDPPVPTAQADDRARLVTAVTETQQQGIPSGQVQSFLSGLPEGVKRRPVPMEEVAAAVNVLPDLPRNGASPETATRLLTAALDAGYDTESLRQLPSALQSARQNSNRPIDALAQGTAQAIAQGTPATSVLQSLFQGSFPGGGPPAGVGNGPPGDPPGNGKPPDGGPPDNPPGGGNGNGGA